MREELGLPPLDADEERGLAQEQTVRQEAQSQLADARNSNRIAPMSDAQAERAAELLTMALNYKDKEISRE